MKELIPIIKAMLEDSEFLAGGVFTKENYYKEKYNLTNEQIVNMQVCLYYVLNIRDEEFNKRVSDINK